MRTTKFPAWIATRRLLVLKFRDVGCYCKGSLLTMAREDEILGFDTPPVGPQDPLCRHPYTVTRFQSGGCFQQASAFWWKRRSCCRLSTSCDVRRDSMR